MENQNQKNPDTTLEDFPVPEGVSLGDVKVAILNVLQEGPICLSELAVAVGHSISLVLEALEDMPDLVEKRRYSFLENNPEFQMWGIARPFKPTKKKVKKT